MAFLYKNLKKYETSVDANFDKKKRSRNQTRKIRKSGIGFFWHRVINLETEKYFVSSKLP